MRDLQERLNECFGLAFRVTSVDDSWMKIATPFWDDHGDQIQIFAATEEGKDIRFSDDGYLYNEAQWAGLDEANVRKLAEPIIKNQGLDALTSTDHDSGIEVIVSPNRLGHAIWDYLHFVLEMLVLIRQAREAGNAD